MSRELLPIDRLDKQTSAFRRELVLLSDRQGLDPSYLAAVMRFESGIDPKAQNPSSKCTGLIQFCGGARKKLDVSNKELLSMTAEQQLPLVEKYFEIVQSGGNKVRQDSLEDHYMAVFAPAFIGRSSSASVYSEPSDAYRLNKGLDSGRDGVISVEDATGKVRPFVTRSFGKPHLLVPDVPDGPMPPGPGSSSPPIIPGNPHYDPMASRDARVAPAVAVGILSFFAVKAMKRSSLYR
jgi:hypothetical protein